MSYMFKDSKLKQLNLSRWDTGNIFEMTNMLDGLGNNSDGFVLSLGKHRLKPTAFANIIDIEGNKKKIVHNSYVYNKKGKKIRKLLVKKGKSVRVYGNPIKIKKKLYYVIDKNKYIKVNNIA